MDSIKISNFRKIKESWELDLAPVTFFTGTNNSGKSTIFKSILLLEDFVKSNNQFQLDFNGVNQRKHKIDSFSNAVNRLNSANLNLDIHLQFLNKGHEVSLVFKPMAFDDGIISKGKLKSLEITSLSAKNKISIENTAADDYLMKIDSTFLSEGNIGGSNVEPLREVLEEVLLIEKNEELLSEDLAELEKQKLLKRDLQATIRRHRIDEAKSSVRLEIREMRLNKVLREFNISLDRAIEFLSSKGVQIEARPTTKIDTEIYFLLADEFSTSRSKRSSSKAVGAALAKEKFVLIDKKIIDLNNKIITYKKRISELNKRLKNKEAKTQNKIVFMPEFSLSDFQDDYLTIDSVIRKVLPKYLVNEQDEFGKTDESIELQKAFSFGEKIRQVLRFSVDHLSPHRNTQTRLYINNNMSSDINEVIREHAINPISKSSKAGKFLKHWMKEFDIGNDFKIKQIEGVATHIEITHDGLKVNLADKGFGAGQVFTILLKIALSIDLAEDKLRASQKGLRHNEEVFSFTILIEEPEANLHPALQVKLANLFYETHKEYRIKFIVETHSEYLIRRSQVIVKQLNESNSRKKEIDIPFMAYYFEKDNLPYSMGYNKDGKFSNEFGSGFFDVSSNLAFDIL